MCDPRRSEGNLHNDASNGTVPERGLTRWSVEGMLAMVLRREPPSPRKGLRPPHRRIGWLSIISAPFLPCARGPQANGRSVQCPIEHRCHPRRTFGI